MRRLSKIQKLLLIAYGREHYISDFVECYGLCSNVDLSKGDRAHFNSWEFCSGYPGFPVPCPSEAFDCVHAFWILPMYSGPYGNLRRDLARHLAKCLMKEQQAIAVLYDVRI